MKCPVCKEANLMMTERQGIEIDYCPECRGVWLDRGELDKFIEHAERQIGDRPRSDSPDRARGLECAYATQVVCQNIPAYWPMALLMKLPFVFKKIASQKPGCNGDSCAK